MTSFEKIDMLRKERGWSGAELMKQIGLSRGVYTQWRKNLQEPSAANLKKLSDLFNVSIADLSNDETEVAQLPDNDDLRFALFHGADVPVTDAMYDEVLRFRDFVVQKEKDKIKKG